VGPQEWFELKVNTSVYVTGLPSDVTVEELCDFFKKAGEIKKCKVYGKGDGLVTFLTPEAAYIAAENLKGMSLRPRYPLHVEMAEFKQKGDTYVPREATVVLFHGVLPNADRPMPSHKGKDQVISQLVKSCPPGVTCQGDRIYRKTRLVTLQFQSADQALAVVTHINQQTSLDLGEERGVVSGIRCEIYDGSQMLKGARE